MGNFRFSSGLLNDTKLTSYSLLFVLITSVVFGILYASVYILGDIAIYFGATLSVILVPASFGIGYLINYGSDERAGFDADHIKKEKRFVFFGQKLLSAGITWIIFMVCIVITLMTLIPATIAMINKDGLVNMPFISSIVISAPFILTLVTMPALGWMFVSRAFSAHDNPRNRYLILALVIGMLSTFPSLFMNNINNILFTYLSGNTLIGDLLTGIISAPVFEELFKIVGFLFIYRLIRNQSDGLIYGIAFGAGFALVENILYGGMAILLGGNLLFSFLIGFRSFSMIIHMIGPAAVGFVIGLFRSSNRKKMKKRGRMPSRLEYWTYLFLSVLSIYILAIVNHALWNTFASVGFIILLFMMLIVVLILYMILISLMLTGYYLNDREERETLSWS